MTERPANILYTMEEPSGEKKETEREREREKELMGERERESAASELVRELLSAYAIYTRG